VICDWCLVISDQKKNKNMIKTVPPQVTSQYFLVTVSGVGVFVSFHIVFGD
jgi:hypothetical protein